MRTRGLGQPPRRGLMAKSALAQQAAPATLRRWKANQDGLVWRTCGARRVDLSLKRRSSRALSGVRSIRWRRRCRRDDLRAFNPSAGAHSGSDCQMGRPLGAIGAGSWTARVRSGHSLAALPHFPSPLFVPPPRRRYNRGMEENPYRAPREQGTTLSRPFQFSLRRSILAIAMVAPGIGILFGIWQIRTTQDLVVLFGALPCIPIAGALFGGALAVFLNPPRERESLAITVGGMIVFLVAFGAWVFTR